MVSNTSGFSLSRTSIRSRMAIIMLFVLSSEPCLVLFSAAPKHREKHAEKAAVGKVLLTLKAVRIEQIFALFVTLNPTL